MAQRDVKFDTAGHTESDFTLDYTVTSLSGGSGRRSLQAASGTYTSGTQTQFTLQLGECYLFSWSASASSDDPWTIELSTNVVDFQRTINVAADETSGNDHEFCVTFEMEYERNCSQAS